MKKIIVLLFCFSLLVGFNVFSSRVMALEVGLTLTPGVTISDTLVFSADLTGISGLTEIGSIRIVDDGTTVGGADGIFSGFDLDAIFLDMDGSLLTVSDRSFASSYVFSAGTTRPTSNPGMLPNVAHPGPTFGSLDATTVDLATATLDVFDAVSVADVNIADAFLTLGDGGILIANFSPEVTVGATLYLITGEVGWQAGEGLGAFVTVSDEPQTSVPEPGTIFLLLSGIIALAGVKKEV